MWAIDITPTSGLLIGRVGRSLTVLVLDDPRCLFISLLALWMVTPLVHQDRRSGRSTRLWRSRSLIVSTLDDRRCLFTVCNTYLSDGCPLIKDSARSSKYIEICVLGSDVLLAPMSGISSFKSFFLSFDHQPQFVPGNHNLWRRKLSNSKCCMSSFFLFFFLSRLS